MTMQPDKIHKIISEKYDKLIWSIARKISGDIATSSLEDNYSDLWLAVFEAIEGFTKQNNYSNGAIEDWIDSRSFDKYLKTCLWNKKNHKGKQIANKYHIHRDTVPTHLEEVLNVSDPSNSYIMNRDFSKELKTASSFVRGDEEQTLDFTWWDLEISLTEGESRVMDTLLENPLVYLTARGKLKIYPLQKKLNWSRQDVKGAVLGIKKKMNGIS